MSKPRPLSDEWFENWAMDLGEDWKARDIAAAALEWAADRMPWQETRHAMVAFGNPDKLRAKAKEIRDA